MALERLDEARAKVQSGTTSPPPSPPASPPSTPPSPPSPPPAPPSPPPSLPARGGAKAPARGTAAPAGGVKKPAAAPDAAAMGKKPAAPPRSPLSSPKSAPAAGASAEEEAEGSGGSGGKGETEAGALSAADSDAKEVAEATAEVAEMAGGECTTAAASVRAAAEVKPNDDDDDGEEAEIASAHGKSAGGGASSTSGGGGGGGEDPSLPADEYVHNDGGGDDDDDEDGGGGGDDDDDDNLFSYITRAVRKLKSKARSLCHKAKTALKAKPTIAGAKAVAKGTAAGVQHELLRVVEKNWPQFFNRVNELMFRVLQLLVLSSATHVTTLLKLISFTRWAPRPEPDTCGAYFENGIYKVDETIEQLNRTVAENMFLVWFTLLMCPMWLFYMPMLFSKRKTKQHGRGKRHAKLLKLVYLCIGLPIGMVVGVATHLPLMPYLLRVAYRVLSEGRSLCSTKRGGFVRGLGGMITEEATRKPLWDLGGGLLAIIWAYVLVFFDKFWSNIRRLVLLTCGIWTEDMLDEFRILERAAKVHRAQRATLTGDWVCSAADGANGLRWRQLPHRGKPPTYKGKLEHGRHGDVHSLRVALLSGKTAFTADEWAAFAINDLRLNHYVEADSAYFVPDAAQVWCLTYEMEKPVNGTPLHAPPLVAPSSSRPAGVSSPPSPARGASTVAGGNVTSELRDPLKVTLLHKVLSSQPSGLRWRRLARTTNSGEPTPPEGRRSELVQPTLGEALKAKMAQLRPTDAVVFTPEEWAEFAIDASELQPLDHYVAGGCISPCHLSLSPSLPLSHSLTLSLSLSLSLFSPPRSHPFSRSLSRPL